MNPETEKILYERIAVIASVLNLQPMYKELFIHLLKTGSYNPREFWSAVERWLTDIARR